MKRSDHFSPRAFVGVFLTVLILSAAAHAQGGGDDEGQLPRGRYTVSSSPFMGAGYEMLPVLVTGVTSDIDGIAVTRVSIENRTDKTLTAVRLVWYLSSQESPQRVLQQGTTRLLNLHRGGGIEAGETREVVNRVVAFADIYKPLLRGGVLRGKYLIQVAVAEARFGDGSVQPLMSSGGKRVRAVR